MDKREKNKKKKKKGKKDNEHLKDTFITKRKERKEGWRREEEVSIMAPIIIQHRGKLKAGVWLTLKHFAVCLRVMETAPQANWSPPQACLTLSEPKFKDLSKLQVRTALQTLKI